MSNTVRTVIAALSFSAAAFVGLTLNEGYSDRAIIPVPGDVPTIGFGTTDGVRMGDRTTPPKALARALKDVEKTERGVKACITAPLSPAEYDAYVDLAYNIGVTAFCNSTLVKKLNAKDYLGACNEVLRWDKANGKRLGGLTARRQAEHAQCMTSQGGNDVRSN